MIDAREIEEGDLIRATLGEEELQGRVTVLAGWRYVSERSVGWLSGKGYTFALVKKAEKPLPEKTGFYVSSKDGGTMLHLSPSGTWYYLGTEDHVDHASMLNGAVSPFLPLTYVPVGAYQ